MMAGIAGGALIGATAGTLITYFCITRGYSADDEHLLHNLHESYEQTKTLYHEELNSLARELNQEYIFQLSALLHAKGNLQTYYDRLTLSLAQLKTNNHRLQVKLDAWKSSKKSMHLATHGTKLHEEISILIISLDALLEMISAHYPLMYLYEVMHTTYDAKYHQETQLNTQYQQKFITMQEYVNQLHGLILNRMSDACTPYPYLAYIEAVNHDLALLQGSLKACSRIEVAVPAYKNLYYQAEELTKTLKTVHEYVATSDQYQQERIKHEHAEQLHKIAEAEQQKAAAELRIAKAREDEVTELRKQTRLKEQEIENLRYKTKIEAEKLEYEIRFQPTRIRLEQEIADLTKNNKHLMRERQDLEQVITGLRGDLHDLKTTIQRLHQQTQLVDNQRIALLAEKEKILDTVHRHLNQLDGILRTPPYNPDSLPDEWPQYFKTIRNILHYLKQELHGSAQTTATTHIR
jgi:hypothetical protein